MRSKIVFVIVIIIGLITGSLLGRLYFDFKNKNLGASVSATVEVENKKEVDSTNTNQLSNPNQSASLIFVGDIMLSRSVQKQIERNGNDYSFPFASSSEFLKSSDFTFGNLEGPISDQGKDQGSIYSFRSNPRVVEGLISAGFDVVSLANNHIWDWGKEALKDTINILKNNKIMPVGAGINYQDANNEKMLVISNGSLGEKTRIGFLAFTNLYPKSLIATEDSPGISNFDIENIKNQILKIKEGKSADLVVVSVHWGEEYQQQSNMLQQSIAHQLIDAGADIIIGHHPHVIQEVEQYKGKWVFYSLGNFIFDQNFSKETMEGLVAKVTLVRDTIEKVDFYKSKLNRQYQIESIESIKPTLIAN